MYREKGYATMRSLLRNDAGGCLSVSTGVINRVEMTGGRGRELEQAAHKRKVTHISSFIFMAKSEAR
jgi:hypothetical protein